MMPSPLNRTTPILTFFPNWEFSIAAFALSMIVEKALDSIMKLLISMVRIILTISILFFINILSLTTKSITPSVAISALKRLLGSTVELSIPKLIPQILQIALVFEPSNLKYPFTYALHLVHLSGELTCTLWTRSEPKGETHNPRGKLDFRVLPNVRADVGLRNSGPAS